MGFSLWGKRVSQKGELECQKVVLGASVTDIETQAGVTYIETQCAYVPGGKGRGGVQV